ncbi:MAG: tRNA 2-thiocytidine biosynthesis TtcA family protein [Spirochaetaceae bacterium]|jgi:tRNA 2-thiocytidine biosynthesis protein TtcA|nr:tRNA 2-thiocytidine biosynthesis TtcA family protein [Spirochaetaceae bacterium]
MRGKENAARTVQNLAVRAIKTHGLIQEGDRILAACSGGKDSTVLAWALAASKRALGVNYTIEGIHISSDFCSCCKKILLQERLAGWGIPLTDKFVPVIGRLKGGRRMNCYWCSTQRRTELLKFAVEGGFNKIALGHHGDDIIETFFMNLLGKGDLSAMPVILEYRNYPVTLIRPLGYAEERQIIAAAEELDCMKSACTCPYGRFSARKMIRERIAAFAGGSAQKRRILRALAEGGLLEVRRAADSAGKLL